MRTLSAIASAQTDTVLSPSRTGDIFYVYVVLMPDYWQIRGTDLNYLNVNAFWINTRKQIYDMCFHNRGIN